MKNSQKIPEEPKKAGTAWLHDHPDQIAHLRVLRANRHWEALWN